jgi:hypothetical protein
LFFRFSFAGWQTPEGRFATRQLKMADPLLRNPDPGLRW